MHPINFFRCNAQAIFLSLPNFLIFLIIKHGSTSSGSPSQYAFLLGIDEDLKMICVSSIDSLFSKVKNDEKGTGEESTLGRRHPNISEGENLVEN